MARKILTSTSYPAGSNFHYYHLPKGMLKVTVMEIPLAGGRKNYDISATEVMIPDPQQRYFFRYHANAFSNDKIDIQFSKEGFLKRIDTTMEDKTGAVVDAIVDTVAEVAKAVTGLRSVGEPVKLFEEIIDPFDEATMSRINGMLAQVGNGFTLGLEPLVATQASGESSSLESGPETPTGANLFGVYCRPVEPYQFIVRSGNVEQRQLVMLPHHEVVHFVEIPYARFVTNKFTMEFNDTGYPISIHVEKPSQALAIIEMPLRVIKAILDIPAQIFQFRINYNNQRLQSVKSEQALQQALQQREAQNRQLQQQASQAEAAETVARAKIEELEGTVRTYQERLASN
ncbi:MAG: hypothetical protein D6730_05575 [Bacteroidetes bacterium]|nr:MAG: hypothetical protein D6730_05575 [Bacteroidota bacterium]